MNRLFFFALIALTSQLPAATYFVRTDGNNACNGAVDAPGSSGNCAKRTIQAGINLAFAGDTVIVHAGSYAETLTSRNNGSSDSLITFKAYTGEVVSTNRIDIPNNYIVLDGFTITQSGGFTAAGIHITGNHEQIRNNIIRGNCNTCIGGEGACTGLSDYGTGGNLISNNTWDGLTNGAGTAFGQAIYTEATTSGDQITHNIIKDVNTPGRLFELYGTNHDIAHNEVRHVTDAGCTSVHTDLFQCFSTASKNMVIEDNYFHDLQSQYVMLADNGSPAGTESYWTFRNNIFANINHAGFIKAQHIVFYNNTFFNVGPGPGTNPLVWSTDIEGHGEYGAFINNILVTTSDQGIASDGTTIANNYFGTLSYGSYNAPSGAPYVDGGNPQFAAAYTNCVSNSCNFHIGSSSVVKAQGQDLSTLFTTDYEGTTRAGTWDLGAYEYPKEAAPTNLTAIVK